MDWRFSLKVELTRKADRFDVRGKEKGGTQVILRCCVYAACAELEETEGRTVGCKMLDGKFYSGHITGEVSSSGNIHSSITTKTGNQQKQQ